MILPRSVSSGLLLLKAAPKQALRRPGPHSLLNGCASHWRGPKEYGAVEKNVSRVFVILTWQLVASAARRSAAEPGGGVEVTGEVWYYGRVRS